MERGLDPAVLSSGTARPDGSEIGLHIDNKTGEAAPIVRTVRRPMRYLLRTRPQDVIAHYLFLLDCLSAVARKEASKASTCTRRRLFPSVRE